ncbi:MAG: hypothetical protein IJ751_09520, partial [Oscillospiraceae bacterium]|nr:hypothetical protein [Oscillospiraceae bacterium]
MKHLKQILALGLSGALLLGCLTGCGQAASAETSLDGDAASEAAQISAAAESLLRSHGSTEGKEETVYVVADPTGAVTETIVSAWLKNPEGKATLADSAELSDIENVKGDETYTQGADGTLTWQADGSDIYYQGKTDRELPVTTHIAYTLDGKTVTPEELAGATGHLEITFTYTNNTAEAREVDGETVTLYQPFLVISGLVLDNDVASGVEVTNG